LFLFRFPTVDLPYGQRNEQEQGDAQLDKADDAVSAVPNRSAESVTHHERADDRPHAPETMQPAHMFRRIVERDVVVQRGVDGARPQTVGHGEDDKHPESVRKGKTEQGDGREEHADHGYDAGAELSDELVGQKAGHDRAARYDHGYDAHIGHGHVHVRVYFGPARTEKGIRQSEADESYVDENEQKRIHPCFLRS